MEVTSEFYINKGNFFFLPHLKAMASPECDWSIAILILDQCFYDAGTTTTQ